MKKFVLTLLVLSLAIPALALDITLVDNGDGTATIKSTTTGVEDLRGLAIVVSATAAITDVTVLDPATFNVNPDAAYTQELGGTYVIQTGTPIAAVGSTPGEITLASSPTSFTICMGVLKSNQKGANEGVAGTIDLATISAADGTVVTLTLDTDRGGIVGDGLAADPDIAASAYLAQTTITDAAGEPYIRADVAVWISLGRPASWLNNRQCHGDTDGLLDYFGRGGESYVGPTDLAVLLLGWKKAYTGTEATGVPAGEEWIAADSSHSEDLFGRGGHAWVGPTDLTEMLIRWKQVVPADCGQVAP